jgi:hypothetical protein
VAAARKRVPALDHGRRFEVVAPAKDTGRLHLVGKAS